MNPGHRGAMIPIDDQVPPSPPAAWRLRPTETAVILAGLCAVLAGLAFSERRPGPSGPVPQPASAYSPPKSR